MPATSDAACEPRALHLARMALRVVAISALIGAGFGLLDASWAGALQQILYSECIGLSVFALHVFLTRGGERTFRRHALAAVVSIPLGFIVGVNVAAALLGRRLGLPAFGNMAPLAGIVTVVCGAGFIYYFWSRRQIADEAAARADALRVAAESRLKLLQTQIEPHMLFNTLANLRTLVDVDPARAQAMIDELIVYLRATLAASRSTTTTLAAEFAQLRAYLELMKVRMAHRLSYALDLPATLADAAVPPMLLQPVVENAIRHGLEPKIEGGTIRVTARGDAGRVVVEVVDDGVGLDDDYTPGYGITHVRERLATLYGAAAAMTIGATPGGGVRTQVGWPLVAAGA